MTMLDPTPLTFKNGSPTLIPFRCRGCGQAMGWGTGLPLVRVYCSAVCGYDGPLSDNEQRDDMIRNAVAVGMSTKRASEVFLLTRQRVNQVLYGKGA